MEEPLPGLRRPVHLPAQDRAGGAIIHFVTVCTKDRCPVLASPETHAVLVEAWRAATWFAVGRYVVMPDHVHFFCAPAVNPPESLARWMAFWKSHAATHWPRETADGKLWQRVFWDTRLRKSESYAAKWEYVRANPVRVRLVARS
ncbi:MAG: transposase [Opitutae bacterium]|nr:transposase [Opitutae bacterium]